MIEEATAKIVKKGTKVVPSRGTGNLVRPVNGGYITSYVGMRWGSFHKGLDFAGTSNLVIKAADNGVVVSAGWNNGGYGYRVVIDHNNGMRTTYSHMSAIMVQVGEVVRKGQQIGVMGQTGFATGVHLHFEVYVNGSIVNPLDYL